MSAPEMYLMGAECSVAEEMREVENSHSNARIVFLKH